MTDTSHPEDHDHNHAGHDHGHDDEDHHDSGHGHGHSHGHSHSHAPKTFGRAFAIGITLNLIYVALEAGYGVLSHSLALIADAGHNLGDVLGLAAAWGAAMLGRKAPTSRFTYGLQGSSILAALGNGVVLLVVTGAIAWEAVRRFGAPEPVGGVTVMAVAAAGIVINGLTAWMFMSGRKGDLNIRGAFMHMAADALVAAGVVVAGGVILVTGWLWLDPLISLAISAIIVWGTWSLLRDSVKLALQGVPASVELNDVEAYLGALPGVQEVHDLHVWGMSTTETALTCHLVRPDADDPGEFLRHAAAGLAERFDIVHATFQLEQEAGVCVCTLQRPVRGRSGATARP